MNSRRGKKVVAEAGKHTDSPSKADFMLACPNDAAVRARFWNWLDDKFTKQDEYIKQQTELIKDMITEAKNSLMSEIELKFSSLKNEILAQAKIEIKSEMRNEFDELGDRISVLEATRADVLQLKDNIKALELDCLNQANFSVASEIRISGIPSSEDENLHEIFGHICNALDISKPPCKNIYRIRKSKQRNLNATDQPIVVKFDSPQHKNLVLKCAADFRRKNKSPLRLSNAGYDSNSIFYINENLIPHYHGIFKNALALKKNGRLKSVYTRRGVVYVKTSDAGDPIQLNFPEQLDQLFRS